MAPNGAKAAAVFSDVQSEQNKTVGKAANTQSKSDEYKPLPAQKNQVKSSQVCSSPPPPLPPPRAHKSKRLCFKGKMKRRKDGERKGQLARIYHHAWRWFTASKKWEGKGTADSTADSKNEMRDINETVNEWKKTVCVKEGNQRLQMQGWWWCSCGGNGKWHCWDSTDQRALSERSGREHRHKRRRRKRKHR